MCGGPCSGPGFDSRPRSLCCVLLSLCFLSYLQLYCQWSHKRPKNTFKKKTIVTLNHKQWHLSGLKGANTRCRWCWNRSGKNKNKYRRVRHPKNCSRCLRCVFESVLFVFSSLYIANILLGKSQLHYNIWWSSVIWWEWWCLSNLWCHELAVAPWWKN